MSRRRTKERIAPTYGTRKQRQERKRREAEERNFKTPLEDRRESRLNTDAEGVIRTADAEGARIDAAYERYSDRNV